MSEWYSELIAVIVAAVLGWVSRHFHLGLPAKPPEPATPKVPAEPEKPAEPK